MGMHLGTDLTALETVGDGKVLEHINKLLERYQDTLASYQINEDSKYFVNVKVLFLHELNEGDFVFKFRILEYSRDYKDIEDIMQKSLKYSTGITEFQMNYFLELKQFYLENTSEKVVEGGE